MVNRMENEVESRCAMIETLAVIATMRHWRQRSDHFTSSLIRRRGIIHTFDKGS